MSDKPEVYSFEITVKKRVDVDADSFPAGTTREQARKITESQIKEYGDVYPEAALEFFNEDAEVSVKLLPVPGKVFVKDLTEYLSKAADNAEVVVELEAVDGSEVKLKIEDITYDLAAREFRLKV